jgi:hypothetical protein
VTGLVGLRDLNSGLGGDRELELEMRTGVENWSWELELRTGVEAGVVTGVGNWS